MAKILVPLASGFEEIEAISIIDVVRRTNIEVITASMDDNLLVKGANNINIQANTNINSINIEEFDMIVLPGGWGGTDILASNETVQDMLKFMKKEKIVAAICAAPYALHKAGVLSHNYTCYPSVEEKIRLDGYHNSSSVVIDGNVITSRGPGTAICFALQIVKKLQDDKTYEELKEGLLANYCS